MRDGRWAGEGTLPRMTRAAADCPDFPWTPHKVHTMLGQLRIPGMRKGRTEWLALRVGFLLTLV